MKRCNLCGGSPPHVRFHINHSTKDGFMRRCVGCVKASRRPYKPAFEVRRRHLLKYKYGITSEDFNQLLKEQNGRCRICNKPPCITKHPGILVVDHNHITGDVRGLLCHKCNGAIGLLGDNWRLLQNALVYLKESE